MALVDATPRAECEGGCQPWRRHRLEPVRFRMLGVTADGSAIFPVAWSRLASREMYSF